MVTAVNAPRSEATGRRAALACAAAGTAALVLPACNRAEHEASFQSLDVSGAGWGGGFSLLDADGRRVQLADFKGRCVLLFFGFTQCPDVCPTALSRAAEVMQRLGSEASRLQVIFITVDPERDSPAVLRDYPRAFHPSFIGLHADLATTEATAKAFKVFYRKVPTGSSYTMDHSTTSYLFDPAGRLRLVVRHAQDAASVVADITRLLKENR